MLEFLLRLVIGLFVVYILMFMASLGLILISPEHRKVVSEAAEDQKRSRRFLTTFAATFASAIFAIPNGFLVGLIPYQFFSTITSSIFCSFLVSLVTAGLWSLLLYSQRERRKTRGLVKPFVRNFLTSFAFNTIAILLIRYFTKSH